NAAGQLCSGDLDADCPIICGNGIRESGETCDGTDCPTPASCDDHDPCTTDSVSGSDCQRVCTHAPVNSSTCLCGNGRADPSETCDPKSECDKRLADCAADLNPCTVETVFGSREDCNVICLHTPVADPACACGNGSVDLGESCDNSSPNPADKCPTSCS